MDEDAGSENPRSQKGDDEGDNGVCEPGDAKGDMHEVHELSLVIESVSCVLGELGAEEEGDNVDGVPMSLSSLGKLSFGKNKLAFFLAPASGSNLVALSMRLASLFSSRFPKSFRTETQSSTEMAATATDSAKAPNSFWFCSSEVFAAMTEGRKYTSIKGCPSTTDAVEL